MHHDITRKILEKIQSAHAADPKRVNGEPAEALYADRVERWLGRLVGEIDDVLRIAARCQHLERWSIPRASFPMDRPGYLKWRIAVHNRQGERAREIVIGAGGDQTTADRIAKLVAKKTAKGDREGQALEDAACLVFLEHELQPFAAEHADYTREKFIDIIRKTWVKMSAKAHELSAAVPLPPALAELVRAAAQP